jgi:hypothetical protein
MSNLFYDIFHISEILWKRIIWNEVIAIKLIVIVNEKTLDGSDHKWAEPISGLHCKVMLYFNDGPSMVYIIFTTIIMYICNQDLIP